VSLLSKPVVRPSAGGGLTALRGEPDLPATISHLGDAWVIVELAPDGILVVDEHGRILLGNRSAETMFGYSRDELTTLDIEALVPQDSRYAHRSYRNGYNACPRTRPMGLDHDLLARGADGSEFPVEISVSPATLGGGSRFVVIVREVAIHRASELAARERIVFDDEERIAFDLEHRVVAHLFVAGMRIQSVFGRMDDESVPCLVDAVQEVNTAIKEIRNTVFHQGSSVAQDRGPHQKVPQPSGGIDRGYSDISGEVLSTAE
jgi:PAS domain S-box-containing protein